MEFGGYSHNKNIQNEITKLSELNSADDSEDYFESASKTTEETNENEHTKKIDLESSIKKKVISDLIVQLKEMIGDDGSLDIDHSDSPIRDRRTKQTKKHLKHIRKINDF